nr:TRAP transporter small permease [uncultured Cohaesibacter sp.]
MSRFYRLVYFISTLAAIVAAAALVFMVGLIALEILLRSLFSTSTFMTAEFVGYAVATCTVWSLGYVLEHEQLIRVNLLLARFPERVQDVMTAISAALLLAGTLGLAWMFWLRVARAWARGTVSPSIAAVPVWIPESVILAGLLVFALQIFAHGLRYLQGYPTPAPREPQPFTE